MYSETDRTYIRRFQGFSAIWLQADPRLENAITATQSIADGGARPDSNAENLIKSLIYGAAAVTGTSGVVVSGTTQNDSFSVPAVRGLIQIEAQIAQLDSFLGASQVDGGDVKVNAVREQARLRAEGRRLVYQMSRHLGMRGPRVDVFSSGQTTEDADPFWASDSPYWA